MLPRLQPGQHLPERYREFLSSLADGGFRGDIRTDYATRLVTATDNSVYQIVPQGVVYPRSEADVRVLLGLTQSFPEVKLSPRGGGTGTNGQSLCDGIIVDVSRHLRDILELDLQAGWVRVQPGVVLDELNAYLAPHGVFFAPSLSPSNRATLGGMINTDACGKGSRIYGKTSQHVLGLRAVLLDGSLLETRPLDDVELDEQCARRDRVGAVHREIKAIHERSHERFKRELPELTRFLTGYDLAHLQTADGRFDLGRVLTGSEGTLAIVTEAKLRLTPIPKHKTLVAIRYPEFDSALRAAQDLVATNPGAIETIDDTIVGLAQGDVIWHEVGPLLDAAGEPPLAAVNLVEFESHDPDVVDEKVTRVCSLLDQQLGKPGCASGYTVAREPAAIASLWALRKKGVGLLGNAPGERRPVPFVEDTVVPPHRLADYIKEFRALLDAHGLRYGMFGHVDVGCLHVRPALNLRDEADEALVRHLSDRVVDLVKKYGGVLWGEHGKGYRSEYTPTFFGPELYGELRAVKAAFDPANQLNPGKLATPAGTHHQLLTIDQVTRGAHDRQIIPATQDRYAPSVNCNGNGACFDWNPDSVMCPSSKVTQDRIHSPKGRAGILREWLRLTSRQGYDAGAHRSPGEGAHVELVRGRGDEPDDFSHEVYDAMAGCLACKACATQCPIKVDIPTMRSEFLEQYHSRYRRPIKDYFVALLEKMLQVMVLWPKLSNWLMKLRASRALLHWVGIVDTPALAEWTLEAGLRERGAPHFDRSELRALSAEEKARTVLLVQDAFTTFYEPNVALATYDLLTSLGKRVVFLPYRENGKGIHIKGFVAWFERLVRANTAYYAAVAELEIPLVCIEPAVALTYREEYPHALGLSEPAFWVDMLQEYLSREVPRCLEQLGERAPSIRGEFRLFGHCTERTAQPKSQRQWREVFQALGADLSLEATGCCGMCGVYGHEREHQSESRGIYDMSWGPRLAEVESADRVLVTGHSCRSQVKRFGAVSGRHPAEALVEAMRDER